MKTWLWMLVLLLIGAVSGVILAIAIFPPVPKLFPYDKNELKLSNAEPATTAPKPTGQETDDTTETSQEKKVPRIQVDEEIHDFGVMEDSKKGHHEFVFENAGTAPLKIKLASTTCKCTKGELEKRQIDPGEKTKLVLEWDPKGYTGDFAQTAVISTNDPDRPSVSLKVKGRVHAPMALVPRTIVLGQITGRQAVDGVARLYLFEEENAKIAGVEFTDKKTESHFEVDVKKLSPEEVKDQPEAKAGYRIRVVLKQGMVQGPIDQSVLIKTDSEKLGEIDLPIEGKVVGNISVYGAGWNENKRVFSLGIVEGKQGLKKSLTIVSRNVDGKPAPLRVASITPSGILKASLSEPTTGSSGKVTHAKLTVEIPPGTPATNYIGSEQAPYGHILLETQRPDGPKMELRVSFVVED